MMWSHKDCSPSLTTKSNRRGALLAASPDHRWAQALMLRALLVLAR